MTPANLQEMPFAQGATGYAAYLQLETLLRLQTPCSSVPEERVFIAFHQMTELAFSLIVAELDWLTDRPRPAVAWRPVLRRLCNLTRLATFQMRMLTETLDPAAFLSFRMALGGASGMQSLQYRQIELMSTRLIHLVPADHRAALRGADPDSLFDRLYWRAEVGCCPLRRAESEDDAALRRLARRMDSGNLAVRYAAFPPGEREDAGIAGLLAEYDRLFNHTWGLLHLRCAEAMLDGGTPYGTGGTEWRRFLKAGLARRFFPELCRKDG